MYEQSVTCGFVPYFWVFWVNVSLNRELTVLFFGASANTLLKVINVVVMSVHSSVRMGQGDFQGTDCFEVFYWEFLRKICRNFPFSVKKGQKFTLGMKAYVH
jgi:hypothetical protein